MVIRPPTRADLPGIFAIYDAQVLRGICTFETAVKSPEQRLEWLAQHEPGKYPLIVAEADGRIVGWAGLSQWSPRQAYARTAENSVYVAKDQQGKGIGLALLRALLDEARRTGTIQVVVARIVQPNPASNRLHKSCGFKPIGLMRRVGEKFGRLLDVLLMDIHLDAPAA